jgi:hypothetical protein
MAMTGKRGRWAVVLLVGLVAPTAATAGPFFGDWSWHWHQDPDCPRGLYSPLHYWTTGLFRVRSYCHPSNLDQYPPGPATPVPIPIDVIPYPCRTTPPAPAIPYADPTAYFGRPAAMPSALP